MNDTDRTKLLASAFHDVETTIAGHIMRPLSLATFDVLLRTGNPLARGEEPADGTPEFTRSIMGFVYAHCAPWPDVVRASFDEHEFCVAALIFCGDVTPAEFKLAFGRLEQQSRELEAAQAEAAGGGMAKKQRPATSRGS